MQNKPVLIAVSAVLLLLAGWFMLSGGEETPRGDEPPVELASLNQFVCQNSACQASFPLTDDEVTQHQDANGNMPCPMCSSASLPAVLCKSCREFSTYTGEAPTTCPKCNAAL